MSVLCLLYFYQIYIVLFLSKSLCYMFLSGPHDIGGKNKLDVQSCTSNKN